MKASNKPAFQAFIARIKGGNPAVDAIKKHVAANGCPDTVAWGKIRLHVIGAGGGDLEIAGARLAWRAFKDR
jgi:hypothetical protein